MAGRRFTGHNALNLQPFSEMPCAVARPLRMRHRIGRGGEETRHEKTGGAGTFRLVLSDITQRKRAEDQLRRVHKAESLARMAGAVVYAFNNQLGAVVLNLALAREALPYDAGAFLRMNEAMKAAGKAAEVSTLMLTYLGQAAGKGVPLDFSEVAVASCPRFRPPCRTRAPWRPT